MYVIEKNTKLQVTEIEVNSEIELGEKIFLLLFLYFYI